MNKNEVLSELRKDPVGFLSDYSIYVEQEDKPNDPTALLGGQREINFSKLSEDFYKFVLHYGTYECYYYPYITQFTDNSIPGKILNVGHCLVPIDAPVGTIVLTGGVNGCALQINRTADGKYLIFMHDKNSRSMKTSEQKEVLLTYMQNYNKGVSFGDLSDYIIRIEDSEKGDSYPQEGFSYSKEYNHIVDLLKKSSKIPVPIFIPITVKTSENRWEIVFCPYNKKFKTGPSEYERIQDDNGKNICLSYSFNV